jgi:hypothetical protein
MLVKNLRRLARHEPSDHSIAAEAADRIAELESALRELVAALDANDENGTHGGRYGGAADLARALLAAPNPKAGDDCPKCGGELHACIHRYQDGPGNYPDCSWLSCLDCTYRTDPE